MNRVTFIGSLYQRIRQFVDNSINTVKQQEKKYILLTKKISKMQKNVLKPYVLARKLSILGTDLFISKQISFS